MDKKKKGHREISAEIVKQLQGVIRPNRMRANRMAILEQRAKAQKQFSSSQGIDIREICFTEEEGVRTSRISF